VIRRVDEDDVEILFRQQLAPVAVETRTLLRHLPRRHQVRRVVQHLAVDVAHRDHVDRRDLHHAQQVRLAVPPRPDDADALTGADLRGQRFVAHEARRRDDGGAAREELSTIHMVLRRT